jgi:hypothetical protein
MMRSTVGGDHVELGRLWREWSRVVAIVKRSPHRSNFRVSDEEYGRLHSLLLRSLEPHRITRPERGRCATLYGEMAEICHPWVSLESIRNADRRIVRDLLDRTRTVEQQLTGDRHLRRDLLIALLVASCLSVSAAVFAYHNQLAKLMWGNSSLGVELRSVGWMMVFTLQQFTPIQYTAVLTLAVIAIGMWMMWTTKTF